MNMQSEYYTDKRMEQIKDFVYHKRGIENPPAKKETVELAKGTDYTIECNQENNLLEEVE